MSETKKLTKWIRPSYQRQHQGYLIIVIKVLSPKVRRSRAWSSQIERATPSDPLPRSKTLWYSSKSQPENWLTPAIHEKKVTFKNLLLWTYYNALKYKRKHRPVEELMLLTFRLWLTNPLLCISILNISFRRFQRYKSP